MSWRPISHYHYHTHPALGSSSLKLLWENPAKYYAEKALPDWLKSEGGYSIEFGTDLHCALLEPERFQAEYVIVPEEMDRRKKEFKDFEKSHEGKKVRVGRPAFHLKNCIEAVKSNKQVMQLLELDGVNELGGFWKDGETGVDCKIKPDRRLLNRPILIDIKTTDDISLRSVQKSAVSWHWPLQAAHYLEGANAIEGAPVYKKFVFILVQREPPYSSAVFISDDEFIKKGLEMRQKALHNYAECERENASIKDVLQGVFNLTLPKWAYTAEENNDE